MTNQEKQENIIRALENCNAPIKCKDCPWELCERSDCRHSNYSDDLIEYTLALLKANKEEIMALRRLVEWAEECGFGLDNIYWKEYVKPEELEGMAYIEQLIYIAKKAVKKDE